MNKDSNLDLGLMTEGVVELDPMTGHLVIRREDAKTGGFSFFDVVEYLQKYKGQEVRCIITPMKSVHHMAALVENGKLRAEDTPKVPKLE